MLTFVFITILLQVAYVILCDTAPAIAADRIVSVPFVLRVTRESRERSEQVGYSNVDE